MLPNSEWLVLGLLAMILLKPEDIPKAARILAKFLRQAQQFWNAFCHFELDGKNSPLEGGHEKSRKNPHHLAPEKAKSQPLKD